MQYHFCCLNCFRYGLCKLFHFVPSLPLTHPHHSGISFFLGFFVCHFLYGTTRYFRLILHISFPRPRISYFSKEPWFLPLGRPVFQSRPQYRLLTHSVSHSRNMDVYCVVLIIDPDVDYTAGNSADRSTTSTASDVSCKTDNEQMSAEKYIALIHAGLRWKIIYVRGLGCIRWLEKAPVSS